MEKKQLVHIVVLSAVTGASIVLGILEIFSRIRKLQELINDNSIPASEPAAPVLDDESPFITK